MKEVIQLIHTVDIQIILEFMLVLILSKPIHILMFTIRILIIMEVIKLIMELLQEEVHLELEPHKSSKKALMILRMKTKILKLILILKKLLLNRK